MTATRAELIRQFIPHSPHAARLGIALAELGDGTARLVMPFSADNATMGDVVHGGAIATLADTAAMAAAWATDEVPESVAGSTASLTVDFLSAARGCDLVADAEVVKRGRRLVFVRVTVGPGEGAPVAAAQAVYALG
jgi:uncharacterized protein (TIGR00369 family)